MRWEYRFTWWGNHGGEAPIDHEMMESFNSLGEAGWELVVVTCQVRIGSEYGNASTDGGQYLAVFKRPTAD